MTRPHAKAQRRKEIDNKSFAPSRLCVSPSGMGKSFSMLTAGYTVEHLTVDEVRECLTPVLQRYNILKAVVFGSVARGEPSPHSDVDLILVQRTDKRFLDRYEGLQRDLATAFPYAAIEMLIYTPEEMEWMKQRRFVANALSEGQVIYESE